MLLSLTDLLNRQLYSMRDGTGLMPAETLDIRHFALTGEVRHIASIPSSPESATASTAASEMLDIRHFALTGEVRHISNAPSASGVRSRKNRPANHRPRSTTFPAPMVTNVTAPPLAKIIATSEIDPDTKGAAVIVRRTRDGYLDTRITYSRDYLAHAAQGPYALVPPANLSTIVKDMNEIVAPFPKRYVVD
ncbi:hypothetical protein QR680_011313 [Steinernema hermaphroditum]|uniref:Uncharacterized protein n=1 Tax=Steinernema hermaphroditum TaxID=289476 RepID=A0AA39ITB7_9BILA|nr:hypothetical protein QR680_011313 [Steinernema hermaphroditum]